MSHPSCDRAELVEAMFDGRLGPTEQASIERHLASCVSCNELLRDLDATRRLLQSSTRALAPLEHQRARFALLRQTATAAPSVKRRWPVVVLVGAALTVPLGVWAATASFSFLRDSGPTTATKPTAPAPVASADVHAVTPAPSAPAPEPAAPIIVGPVTSTSRRPHDAPVAKASPSPVPADTSPASRDFAAAMQAVSRGDFSAGASQLGAFAATYPHDVRVEDSLYLQAIALERAGRIDDARSAARRYLTAYPGGAHRAQARRIAGD